MLLKDQGLINLEIYLYSRRSLLKYANSDSVRSAVVAINKKRTIMECLINHKNIVERNPFSTRVGGTWRSVSEKLCNFFKYSFVDWGDAQIEKANIVKLRDERTSAVALCELSASVREFGTRNLNNMIL